MAITADNLRAEVGADSTVPATKLDSLIAVAKAELDEYTLDKLGDIPPEVFDRAHLLVAAEMWHQDQAPNGVLNQQYDLGDGTISSTPIRIGSDPLRPAYSVLARWMPGAVIG